MKLWNQFTIKQKLFFVFFILIALTFYLAFSISSNYYEEYTIANNVKSLTEISIASSNLVHELQKERGLTGGYLSSGRTEFVQELSMQRQASNKWLNELRKFLNKEKGNISREINELEIFATLEMVANLRNDVDNTKIRGIEAIVQYTNIIGNLIQINRINVDYSSEFRNIYSLAKSLYAFTQIKENYGQLRANINRIAVNDSVDYAGYQNVSRIFHLNNYLFSDFEYYSQESFKIRFNELHNKDIYNKIKNRVDLVLNNFGVKGISISPREWFSNSTEFIDELAKIESDILNKLLQSSNNLSKQYYSALILNTSLIIIFIIFSIFLATYIINRISRNIQFVTEQIVKVSRGLI